MSAASRNEPPLDQPRETFAQAVLAEFGEEQRHVGSVNRERTADPECLVERLADQTRRLRFIRQLEARIDVGLERKFAQQRETKRIDRGDGDVSDALANLAPQLGVEAALAVSAPQVVQNPLSHFGSGFSSEGDRENVARLDA